MEGYQAMGHQGTRPAAPPAQLGTQALDPQPTSARIDRDSQLVDALRVGAATAADLLVATYGDRAYRLAIGITRNEQDAEEAVQGRFVLRILDLPDHSERRVPEATWPRAPP